jgi:rod shape-determining protein MreD
MSAHVSARLLAVGLVTGIVQLVFVSQFPVAGGIADLAPLVVMSVALLCGAVPGALFGFALGLFMDVALLQTLGLSSLVLLLVGYFCGRFRELRNPEGALVPLVIGVLATIAYVVGYSTIQFLLDVDAPVSGVILRQLLATLILNALLAIPVYSLVRRSLLPGLPDDPRRRRRPATTTGGLSPLSRA